MSSTHVEGVSAEALAHHILLVEDDPASAESLKVLLEQHGFRVQVAKDGGQAHSAFRMRRPDFVIMDLILPGENGFEVIDRMKHSDETVPVLVLSAISLEDSKALSERLGADGYMTKPASPNDLLEEIKSIAQRIWERTHQGQPKEEKRIRFSCRCGKKFKVSPVHRGRTLTCPDCGEPLIVPRHD
ncbi:MAG TPA: response regulator [Planctomycetaceae bacterium]|nr:response regulator [Planctomycetaceae bacterium]